jgi:hypothetical protein
LPTRTIREYRFIVDTFSAVGFTIGLLDARGAIVLARIPFRPRERVVIVIRLKVVEVRKTFAVADGLETPFASLEVCETIPLEIAAGLASQTA